MLLYKKYIKRIIDVILAFVTLIIISPLLIILIIILFFANKRAGVFFFQARPGKNEKTFNVIKFKSMTDATDSDGNLLQNEQRITPKIGRAHV